jgi:hypothetical protein
MEGCRDLEGNGRGLIELSWTGKVDESLVHKSQFGWGSKFAPSEYKLPLSEPASRACMHRGTMLQVGRSRVRDQMW